MKTVMKKMFSLLLVAVLLVSAVPTAFADGVTCTRETCANKGNTVTAINHGESTEATCTVDGEICYYCDGDGGKTTGHNIRVTIPATGHSPSAAATCSTDQICTVCNTVLEAAHHTWGPAATCTTAQTCTACGVTNVSALTHQVVTDAAVPATCYQPGLTEGSHCGRCGEVLVLQEETPTVAHTFGEDGKCTVEGCGFERCSVCESTEHLAANCPESDDTVKVYLNLNYGNAYEYGENIEYIWVERDTLLRDVVANIAEPNRDKHSFQHWTTDQNGANIIDNLNEARATSDGVMIYAQWVDIVQSTTGTVDLTLDLNYGGHKQYINNIDSGSVMADILGNAENAGIPVRLNYKFRGWYWDKNCTNAVDLEGVLKKDATIYAKWEYRYTNNEILLKVYLNGNTHFLVRTVDMYKYTTDDGWVSMSEVKEAVKQFYTGRNSEGLHFEGLYTPDEWSKYVTNPRTADDEGSIEMNYEPGYDTIIYVMVNNAKARTYTSSTTTSSTTYKADSSNPKTGDAIYTPVIVMGASVTALAVLFYLNKKRAF